MSDKDLPFHFCRFVLCFGFWSCFYFYIAHSIDPNFLVAKFEFPSDCIDSDGNTRSHLEEWTTTTGSCDRHICYSTSLENKRWKVSHECPDRGPIYDTANCEFVSNSSLSFPYCCPMVSCSVGVLPNNTPAVNLSACSDLAKSSSCEFWKNLTQCTDSTNTFLHFLYNLTLTYCRRTCVYCT